MENKLVLSKLTSVRAPWVVIVIEYSQFEICVFHQGSFRLLAGSALLYELIVTGLPFDVTMTSSSARINVFPGMVKLMAFGMRVRVQYCTLLS